MKKKVNKGGSCVRHEPMDLKLLNEDPSFVEAFSNVRCLQFCQKLQGFHAQISKDFVVKFTATASKVGVLNFTVSPDTIYQATEIPREGEEWFKAIKFKMQSCDEFVKPKHIGADMASRIPRSYMKENYSKLLFVIQKYFTCEGRFHMVYMYHFRLLLHFTGKQSFDLPFYLFRSLGKMSDKVQARAEGSETSIFHHGLIKLLMLEKLKKLNRDWTIFLFLDGYEVDSVTPKENPKPKATPSNKNDKYPFMTEGVNEEEAEPILEPMDFETEPIQEAEIPQPSSTSNKQKISKHGSRRITRSQTIGKGNLEDILQAIDIEETPVVKAEDIEDDKKKKKKGKIVKKLDFVGEDASF